MQPPRTNLAIATVLACGLAAVAPAARQVTLSTAAKVRDAPSRMATQLATIPPGTVVLVLDETGSWPRVQLPDGRIGYVWHDLVEGTGTGAEPPAPPAEARTATTMAAPAQVPAPAPAASAADELRALRADVEALRARVDPGPELQRLRSDVQRLESAQQELERRLVTARAPSAEPADGTLGGSLALLLIGGTAGWIISRLARRRHDRRDRIRV